MLLFRSEEHASNWALFNPEFEENLRPLSFYLEQMGAERIRERVGREYVSWRKAHGM